MVTTVYTVVISFLISRRAKNAIISFCSFCSLSKEQKEQKEIMAFTVS